MAEVSQDSGGGRGKHKGGPKSKKKSTKIDMTAMVDVAFLLLTFFILTTTLATPSAMELNKPPKEEKDKDNTVDVVQDKVMTLILGDNDKVHYYVGIEDPKLKTVDFSDEGIRKTVRDFIKSKPNLCRDVNNAPGCWDPIFVIKPGKKSRYKNMVDALDEMRITNAPKYALTEITPQDSSFMAEQNKQ